MSFTYSTTKTSLERVFRSGHQLENVSIEMNSEETNPSDDIHPADETENDDDTGTSTSSSSSQPPARRSRFFRSRRKLRVNPDSSSAQNENPNESIESSESPEQREEEEGEEETSNDKPSSSTPVKTGWRSTSPPPPVPISDDNDGSTTSDDSKLSTSTEDLEISSDPLSKTSNEIKQEKIIVVQAKPFATPPPSIFAGYQRKKSQSVKLTRIDPMEPCPKKAVRFADDFGLDLSQVKMIKSDELPHVPSEAFKDLRISSEESSTESSASREKTKEIHYLEQQFENPIHLHGFDDRVQRHKIVLEQANAIDNRIYGTIKLLSLGLNKRVKIRLTTDNWNTHFDHEAIYICNSYDGTFDRFSFTLDVDRTQIYPGNVVQFCLCYELSGGPEHWDSNYQQNYRFNCVSRTIPDYSS